jgi:hypothetical protein
MKQTACVLKYIAIVINAILAILFTLSMIGVGFRGSYLVLVSLGVFTAVVNIAILSLAKRLLVGRAGVFFLCLGLGHSLFYLLGAISGLMQWGIPLDAITAMAVFTLIGSPIVTVPALFMLRSQLGKGDVSKACDEAI